MAPLIVITGPTASGKTGLALELAEKYGGEIICADSRTIYRGMDIGTAKPTQKEQARVPHHLIDVVEPGERFTARDFQEQANAAIADIRARGKVPFLVGGTGLYIDAVILDFQWPETSIGVSQYETRTDEELVKLIKSQQLPLPENATNRRHLLNTLKRQGKSGLARKTPLENTIVVAIATDKETLHARIAQRAHEMFRGGVIEETKRLAEQYGWDSEAMLSNIYPIIRQYLEGKVSLEEAEQQFIARDRQLAKRQRTWLRRHAFVQWLSLEEARQYIETTLG